MSGQPFESLRRLLLTYGVVRARMDGAGQPAIEDEGELYFAIDEALPVASVEIRARFNDSFTGKVQPHFDPLRALLYAVGKTPEGMNALTAVDAECRDAIDRHVAALIVQARSIIANFKSALDRLVAEFDQRTKAEPAKD